ncbi:MAG: hypothetical protein AAFV62_05795, partial [Pseudomonadota bacterium]
MLKLCWRGCVHFCSFAVMALFAAVIVVAVRLAAGPVSLAPLLPTIQSSIDDALGDMRVDIQDAVFLWDRERGDLGIRLLDVDLFEGSERLASAPEASVKIHIGRALRGQIAITRA